MKDYPNYGYPLFIIIILILINIIVSIIVILIYFLHLNIFILFLNSFITIPIMFYISLVYYKNQFNKRRHIILKKLINFGRLKGNEVILDLGTGAGFLAIGFAKNLTNGKVYGIDKYSIKNSGFITRIFDIIKINFIGNSIYNAKKNAKIERVEKLCDFIISDFTSSLNFPNNYFDIICSSQSLYLLTPQKREITFKEINRILKKDGKIIFFETKSFPIIKKKWDMEYVKKYFENIGYNINIFEIPEFKRQYICYGNKITDINND